VVLIEKNENMHEKIRSRATKEVSSSIILTSDLFVMWSEVITIKQNPRRFAEVLKMCCEVVLAIDNFFNIYLVLYQNRMVNNFATKKAAVAAVTPIIVTFKAPLKSGWPVTLLLKYPKEKRQIIVSKAENTNPSYGVAVKKYADNGIIPPRM
jgi:hypothetical protein